MCGSHDVLVRLPHLILNFHYTGNSIFVIIAIHLKNCLSVHHHLYIAALFAIKSEPYTVKSLRKN